MDNIHLTATTKDIPLRVPRGGDPIWIRRKREDTTGQQLSSWNFFGNFTGAIKYYFSNTVTERRLLKYRTAGGAWVVGRIKRWNGSRWVLLSDLDL
jgi:hypothetical protein